MNYRTEHDLLGEKKVPAEAYWGIHTARARENFTISRNRTMPVFIRAYAQVKKAAAAANAELGYLDPAISDAIRQACDVIQTGALNDAFPLDALQGGAGTSFNMNMNEVIANKALEILGKEKGDYDVVHPLEQVNLHQSTNDTYPTALRIAVIEQLRMLSDTTARLQGVFQKKEKEFAEVVTIGRTEMQDAVPITMGAQFAACAEAISRDRWRTFKCEERMRVVNLGGTAVGTGLCAPRKYIFLVIEKLRELTGLGLTRGENVMGETAHADACVEVSGILKAQASNLIKISDDLRKLHALGEISIAPVQAGSSMMPGKVNPVLLEAVMQAGITVMANDSMITEATSRATFQINEFMPLIAHALLESLEVLINATTTMTLCVEKVTVNTAVCEERFNKSEMIVTAFVPEIGYERATALMQEYRAGAFKNVREFLTEKLGDEVVEKTLSPYRLMSLGYK